jgi:hypothetical protein
MDHVWPRRFYLKTTPANLQRLTVPACKECGDRFKALEERVFELGALTLDDDDPKAPGLFSKLRESYTPRQGDSPEEAAFRRRTLEAVHGRVQHILAPDGAPGPRNWIQTSSGLFVPTVPAISVSKSVLFEFQEKLVRGIYFKGKNEPLSAATELFNFLPAELDQPEIIAALAASPLFTQLGPAGLVYKVWHTERSMTFVFQLWGRLETAALIATDAEAVAEMKANVLARQAEMQRKATSTPGTSSGGTR